MAPVVLFLVLLGGLSNKAVYGLQCYHCTFNKITTGSSIADAILSNLVKQVASDEFCLLKGNDISRIPAKTCAPASKGKTMLCGTVNGTISFTVMSSLTINYETLSRDCIEVDADSSEASNRGQCHDADSNSEIMRKIASDYFSGLTVSKFTGKACYYGNGLGSERFPAGTNADPLKTALQCFVCSYNKILTGHDLLNQITNKVIQLATEKECLMKSDKDLYEIISKTCPQPSSQDKVQMCAVVRGNVTVNIASKAVVLETISRKCVEVDRMSEQASVNGQCYQEDRESTALQTVINDYFEGLQVSNFQGQTCYFGKKLAYEGDSEGLYSNQGVRITSQNALLLMHSLITGFIFLMVKI